MRGKKHVLPDIWGPRSMTIGTEDDRYSTRFEHVQWLKGVLEQAAAFLNIHEDVPLGQMTGVVWILHLSTINYTVLILQWRSRLRSP